MLSCIEYYSERYWLTFNSLQHFTPLYFIVILIDTCLRPKLAWKLLCWNFTSKLHIICGGHWLQPFRVLAHRPLLSGQWQPLNNCNLSTTAGNKWPMGSITSHQCWDTVLWLAKLFRPATESWLVQVSVWTHAFHFFPWNSGSPSALKSGPCAGGLRVHPHGWTMS